MKKNNIFSLLFVLLSAFSLKAQDVTLSLPHMTVDPGQTFNVEIKASDFNDIASMQFAIIWNPAVIQFQAVNGLNANMPDFTALNNFNTTKSDDGIIRVIWYWFDPATNTGVTLDDNSTLISLRFKAVGSQGTNSMVEITSDTTIQPPFVVEFGNFNDPVGVAVEAGKVTISGVNATEESITQDFTLFQNNPNPFTEITYISFNLNTGSDARLKIFDNNGRVVFQQNQKYPAGLIRIPLRRDMLKAAGSYFYTLETERATATRQLIMQ